MSDWQVICGDCRQRMAEFEPATFDACVCDPPYGLGFMGKGWDHGLPGVEFWKHVLRVLKPGAHLLAFGGTRTFHRLTCAIEDAGFEVRDCLCWLYGTGFPKSLDVSKAIDKLADADTAERWQGWGTALKPAWEPIIMARVPLDGTVAANVLRHGTGAINVDSCRIPIDTEEALVSKDFRTTPATAFAMNPGRSSPRRPAIPHRQPHPLSVRHHAKGRWPANVCLDEAAARALDEQTEHLHWSGGKGAGRGPSRFFYCPKASRAERQAGLGDGDGSGHITNAHPTVKPVSLMCWLVRLVTPPDGRVIDPFMGSGSTGCACVLEGVDFVGIDQSEHYCEIARRCIAHYARKTAQSLFAVS